eukprot:Colp12_sorted_trinity150504_noHs@31512
MSKRNSRLSAVAVVNNSCEGAGESTHVDLGCSATTVENFVVKSSDEVEDHNDCDVKKVDDPVVKFTRIVKRKWTPKVIKEPSIENPWFPVLHEKISSKLEGRFNWYYIAGYYAFATILLFLLVYLNNYGANTDQGVPQFISCRALVWPGSDACGPGGVNCYPFNSTWAPLRCPDRCTWDDSLMVIGTGYYRPDSRLCKAAIHSGVISKTGGCFLYRTTNAVGNFTGSYQNGVQSYGVDRWFPQSVVFSQSTGNSLCVDFSWGILAIVLVVLMVLAFFNVPPMLFYFTVISTCYWYVRLISQFSYDFTSVANSIGVFTGFMAVSFFVWVFVGKKITPGPKFHLELIVCCILPCYLSAHLNYATYFLPDVDINGSALSKGAAGIGMLVLYIVLILALAVYLGRWVWKTGRLLHYVFGYMTGVVIVLIALGLAHNNYGLHIHHYLIALILIPFTRFATRGSLAIHFLLLGLLCNGLSVWGFGSILEVKPGGSGGSGMQWDQPYLYSVSNATGMMSQQVDFSLHGPAKFRLGN